MKRIFLLLASTAILLSGCKKEPELGAPMALRVVGTVGNSSVLTKLTLGMYAGAPIYAENVPLSVGPNAVATLGREVRWGFDQSRPTSFVVYSPYDSSFDGKETVAVEIPCDQSSIGGYRAANYLVGVTTGTPDKSVDVKLEHAMTCMILSFDNRSSDSIVSLTVTGFKTQANFNVMTGTMTPAGRGEAITPMRSPSGEDVFAFLYVPQTAVPVLHVTMASGKVFTMPFDRECYEYPGNILAIGQILITDSTPETHMQELTSVSLMQWNSDDVPSIPSTVPYCNLSTLADVECDAERSNFFVANLKKVVVTNVDKTNPYAVSIIMEDSTRAVRASLNGSYDVKAGNTIVGRIGGCMVRESDGRYVISNLVLDYADYDGKGTLPATESSFDLIEKDIVKLEYRRLLFKDAVLVESFQKDRAIFRQNGKEMPVLCPGIDRSLVPGTKGNLVAFPIMSGNDVILMAYDSSQFDSFENDGADTPFTQLTDLGLYDLSQPDTVSALFADNEGKFQLYVSDRNNVRGMQLTDLTEGKSAYFMLKTGVSPVSGHEYDVVSVMMGTDADWQDSFVMECVKVKDGKAWLVDRSGKNGLIFIL